MKKVKKAVKAFVIAVAAILIINGAAILLFSFHSETRPADAAIILGAASFEQIPSPVFRERINHGIRLQKQGLVKKLIFTGGSIKGQKKSDAAIAKEYAINQGISPKDILIEEKSSITFENLKFAAEIAKRNGIETVLIISDPLHMKRAMAMAKDLDLKAYTSPTPTTMYRSFQNCFPFFMRELFFDTVYQVYRLLSKIIF